MTSIAVKPVTCPDCGAEFQAPLLHSVNVTATPELRARLFSGDINRVACPSCPAAFNAVAPLLYDDPERAFGVWLTPPLDEEDYNAFVRRMEEDQGTYLGDAAVTSGWGTFRSTIRALERTRDWFGPPSDGSPPDVGQATVDFVYRRLKVDDWWAVRGGRGYAWWGGSLAQYVWAEPCFDDAGVLLSRVHVRTDVLTEFADTDAQIAALQTPMRGATVSGLARAPDDPTRLQLAASACVHTDTQAWLQELLAWVAPMQAAEAEVLASELAGQAGLGPAWSVHPSAGPRAGADEMLSLPDAVIRPLGQGPSLWRGPEMESLVPLLQRPPCALVTGDEDGLTAEYPFGTRTSLLQMNTEEPHPWLGAGLATRLTLPRGGVLDDGREALCLNERELSSLTRAPFLGSWCAGPLGLTHTAFLPNALHKAGALTNLAMYAVQRARWTATEVYQEVWDERVRPAVAVENLFGFGPSDDT